MKKKYFKNKSNGLTMVKWKIFFTFILFSLYLISKAQISSNKEAYYKLPIQVSVGNQTVGFPFKNLFSAFNPSFSVGTEVRYNKSLKHSIYQTANFGFFKNEVIGNTLSLNTDFCYRYTHKSGIFADLSLGLGVLNQFHPRDIYEYNSSTGAYDKVNDYGKIAMLYGYGLSVGYDLSHKTNYPVSIFIKNSFYIQSPYFDVSSLSFMPQSITHIGFRIKIRKNEK